ncbi:GDCCVxC domain-containing (seleno)protein [Shewanella cyperi]|uniref:GDCCVxC domain-containing (seleno)protein n=1 Tax=Shewanella cyperi TaxID=2814292 RepID=UPI001D17F7B2|nr:GDCCVxC domain-containing (seleno)protein [Shewanella cyperi]
MSEIILVSEITCPACGFKKVEIMPTDCCVYFYECTSCHKLLKPNPGDCCVFCSFAAVKCPPVQQGNRCCG